MANGVEEIITTLYELVQDAWSLPLGAEKCVIERDKVLDLLDEISNQLPGELKQAKTIVESRNEVITNAKREAENILKQAEQRAAQMVSREEVYKQAEQQAEEMIRAAQQKIKELRQATNDYVDDAMKRTEDTIAQSLSEIRETRTKFRSLVNPQAAKPSPSCHSLAYCKTHCFSLSPLRSISSQGSRTKPGRPF